eukprot:CAMPEP_0185387266 /NCGR_PEP_ID=MMETSP1364-20130426/65824_1 /TAXON_ID=38817 /ORGANISM="Gephyrocapsa oceanica, Strain RCC1303" /LENGTH=55 /DNA_ID=CAMNT_0027989137 /DNA_START=217 /DNA_END=380 /DNA_ORIENTATION=-
MRSLAAASRGAVVGRGPHIDQYCRATQHPNGAASAPMAAPLPNRVDAARHEAAQP